MRPGSAKPMHKKLAKVRVDPSTGCHIWLGAKDRDGYGRMRGTQHGVPWFQFAHRASYALYRGPIPRGKQVLHHCDRPSCINPKHLYLGTPRENSHDKVMRGRARSAPQRGAANGMYGRCGPLNPFFGRHHSEHTKRVLRAKAVARAARRRAGTW